MNSLIIHFTLMIFQMLTLCTIFKRQQGNVQQSDNFIRLHYYLYTLSCVTISPDQIAKYSATATS